MYLLDQLFFYCTVMLLVPLLCFLILAICPRAIPRLLQSMSKSLWPTCARHRSVSLLLPLSLLICSSSTSLTLVLFGCRIQRCGLLFFNFFFFLNQLAICNTVSKAKCVCVCVRSLTQTSWEKRVLKSLNSMSTELGVPLARMVAKILSITANIA